MQTPRSISHHTQHNMESVSKDEHVAKKKKNKDRQLLIIGFYWPHLKTMLLCNLITCNCAEAIWSKGASK